MNNLSDNHKKWLTWLIMSLATLAVSLFFGVQYPMPEQPDQPIEPIPLAAHFSNPVDIEGSASAGSPALTFQGDTDTGLWRSEADTLNISTGGTERLEIDSSGVNWIPAVSFASTIDVDSTANLDEVDIDGVTNLVVGTEHIGTPSILSTAVITSTNGALWTVADGEVWFVWNLFCNVTTNFDCTGNDCALHIGDGNDEDGFLDLDDAELQTDDADITNGTAGWQGMHTDTTGAYLIGNASTGFVYAPSGSPETIDIKLEDASDNSDPTAGAATCYLVYTRLE